MEREPAAVDHAMASLLQGLKRPTQDLLLQLLMYKGIFMGRGFRDLAERETPEVRDVLLRIHTESAAEAVALALAMREWDAHPAGVEGLMDTADDARRRFLEDTLELKEGVVDVGLAAAMRAPNESLRRRFLALADIDRAHADAIRVVLGTRPAAQRDLEKDAQHGPTLGIGTRGEAPSIGRAVEQAIQEVQRRGAEVSMVVLSAEAVRHARDEGAIDARTGRFQGVPIEVEMGWRGECFAIGTNERIGLAEFITLARASPPTSPDGA